MLKLIFMVYFHTWKMCVKNVFWKSFYDDDIQSEIQVPPPAPSIWNPGYEINEFTVKLWNIPMSDRRCIKSDSTQIVLNLKS